MLVFARLGLLTQEVLLRHSLGLDWVVAQAGHAPAVAYFWLTVWIMLGSQLGSLEGECSGSLGTSGTRLLVLEIFLTDEGLISFSQVSLVFGRRSVTN